MNTIIAQELMVFQPTVSSVNRVPIGDRILETLRKIPCIIMESAVRAYKINLPKKHCEKLKKAGRYLIQILRFSHKISDVFRTRELREIRY